MPPLAEVWATITAPQATIVSGGFTLLAAVLGVVVGWRLFSGRVWDLRSALDESERLLVEHRSAIEGTLTQIKESVGGLSEQFTTTLESLGQLWGTVSDLQSATPPLSSNETALGGQADNPEKLRDDWGAIRDELERRAADPNVDGRTRARYARIDRRQYRDLVDELGRDGRLGDDFQKYRQAATIWQRYRSGRSTPTPEDMGTMSHLRHSLAAGR